MADSRDIVKALHDIDPGFVTLCETLFGDAVNAADAWEYLYGTDGVAKMMPDSSAVATLSRSKAVRRGALVATGAAGGAIAGRASKKKDPAVRRYSVSDGVMKSAPAPQETDEDGIPVTWAGEFTKMDTDKRQVFGWASVVEIDGLPIVDRQGDWISPDDIEKAAYQYVLKSRKGGHQHKRDGDQPFHASDMIESFVVTPEKIEKMGLPKDTPVGWWVGYKVHDDEAWSKVKKGEITGFSIHGRGKRVEHELDA